MNKKLNIFFNIWSAVITFTAVFSAFYYPAKLVLDFSEIHEAALIRWVVTIVFTVDIFVNHFIKKKEKRRFYFEEEKASQKFSFLWLTVDVLSAIPFFLFTGHKLFYIFRLLKLTRVAQYLHNWRQKVLRIGDYLLLGYFVFWILIFSHWLACGWIEIRGVDPALDPATNYVSSLYWTVETLTTVGYGEIVPGTNAQYIYAMFVMLMGVAFYGFIIGNIASILSKRDPAKEQYFRNLERLTAFVKFRKIPVNLQKNIRDYYTYIWKKRLGFDETTFLTSLPPGLKNEVSIYLKKQILEKIPLFTGVSDEFINEVANHLRPIVYTPGSYVIKKGETGSEMYFVIQGKLEVLSEDDSKVVANLTSGDFFGEVALFTSKPRNASIKAVEYSDLYILNKKAFDYVLESYPGIGEKIKQIAEERQI